MRLLTMRFLRPQTRRDGATTVEVALTLPVFGILLAGLMEFSHYFMVVHTLNGAARRGALLGSYEGVTNSQVTAKVNAIVSAAFNTSNATVIVKDGSVFDTANVNPNTLNYTTLPAIDLTQAETTDCFLVQVSVPYDNVALLPPFWKLVGILQLRAIQRRTVELRLPGQVRRHDVRLLSPEKPAELQQYQGSVENPALSVPRHQGRPRTVVHLPDATRLR